MRLHDLQVIVSASTIASTYQAAYQQNEENVQKQIARQSNEAAELKKNQVKELDPEANLSKINLEDRKNKEKKKHELNIEKLKRKENESSKVVEASQDITSHLIDLKI